MHTFLASLLLICKAIIFAYRYEASVLLIWKVTLNGPFHVSLPQPDLRWGGDLLPPHYTQTVKVGLLWILGVIRKVQLFFDERFFNGKLIYKLLILQCVQTSFETYNANNYLLSPWSDFSILLACLS